METVRRVTADSKESNQRVASYLAELKKRVVGEVRSDAFSRVLYSTDASIYQVMPYGVLIPEQVEDVQAAIELAASYHVPILARTSGSSLAGQAVNEALVIDMSRYLDRILEVNEEEQWVSVQPGVVLDELNAYLRSKGLQFGPDPASSDRAAMGGIVSNNSTGSHSIEYGMTADHLLSCSVILDDGSMAGFAPLKPAELDNMQRRGGREGQIYGRIRQMVEDAENQSIIAAGTPRHWRRCGGYNLDRLIKEDLTYKIPPDSRFNLAKLICGAEGTLGVMHEMKLKLVPTPVATALAVIHFEDLFTALSSVPHILEVQPSAVELMDNLGLTLCREVPSYARLLKSFVVGQPNCVLITEFYGENGAELDAKLDRLERHLQRRGVPSSSIVRAKSSDQQAKVWTVRKVGLGLLMSIKGDHKPIPFIEDAAVPVDHLAEYVTKVERFCKDLGTEVAYYAHASAGCLHVRPLVNTKLASEIAKLPEIVEFSVDLLHGYGGALSSEHGDGRARSWINERFFGRDLYGLFRQVKKIFDPENLFNPGNIVDSRPMTEALRYGESYSVAPQKSRLDFSYELGFERAIEACNGAGVCRKKISGTMCPSFMVTREEEHSTRGRANALRAALSGLLPPDELTSKRMYEVLDLCVECKACKAECPSSVDMAKIKFEFLARYHEVHGVPWRTRLFANIARISRLACGPQARAINWLADNRPARLAAERFLGITSLRPLPSFARRSFESWFKNRTPVSGNKGKVALFHDAFTNYSHPEIAIAATEFLEAAGFEVVMPGHFDDGRPLISKGLVDKARATAQDTVDRLEPLAEEGMPIVGLEPSSLLTLRDEYRYLLPDDPRVDRIASLARTFEEFVVELAEGDLLDLNWTGKRRQLLVHGHCHAKALVGIETSLRALSIPPNYQAMAIDSGCCGMAGAFGYEVEHYQISQKMAERRLLPAVRQAEPGTILVAAGFSCRHQIEHGTGRKPLHPAQVLREALVE